MLASRSPKWSLRSSHSHLVFLTLSLPCQNSEAEAGLPLEGLLIEQLLVRQAPHIPVSQDRRDTRGVAHSRCQPVLNQQSLGPMASPACLCRWMLYYSLSEIKFAQNYRVVSSHRELSGLSQLASLVSNQAPHRPQQHPSQVWCSEHVLSHGWPLCQARSRQMRIGQAMNFFLVRRPVARYGQAMIYSRLILLQLHVASHTHPTIGTK